MITWIATRLTVILNNDSSTSNCFMTSSAVSITGSWLVGNVAVRTKHFCKLSCKSIHYMNDSISIFCHSVILVKKNLKRSYLSCSILPLKNSTDEMLKCSYSTFAGYSNLRHSHAVSQNHSFNFVSCVNKCKTNHFL